MVCEENIREAFPEEWDHFIRRGVQSFKEFHQIISNDFAKEVPIYFMRYEDQTTEARPILTDLFKFMLQETSIEETVLERRIIDVSGEGHQKRAIYKLKST